MTFPRRATHFALIGALTVHAAPAQMAFAQAVPERAAQIKRAETVSTRSDMAARRDYEACQARDEAQFRDAIGQVTVASLESSIRGLDYRPIVAEAWRKGDIDAVLMRRVDTVLEELKQETSWSELIKSLASKETQQRLAQAAAERVYGSDEMRRAIETLAVSVGQVVGARLELATADAAEPTTRCLEAFLGPRYGTTVARVVARDAGREFAIDAAKGVAPVSRGSVLVESKEGLAGLVAVIMRRQLGNLASRVGQRLVGAVLGRVVSVVAGGIGVVLIAKDIWELRNGVLPIIATEMKAPSTRDKVQAELANSVASEIEAHVKEIGNRTADRVIDIWREFRSAHAKVLELAESNAAFKNFVDNVSPAHLARLDEIVALQLAAGGETRLLSRVADGSLAEAVQNWPAAVLEIARDRRSLEAGFKWRALAGDGLVPKVLEFEVHRVADPSQLTRAGLVRVLALDDRVAVSRLAPLPTSDLEPLLELADPDLKRLARALDSPQLASLSGYLTSLDRPAAKRMLTSVAQSPARMQWVAPDRVRDAILASRDQTAAVDMMLRGGEILDLGEFAKDIDAVRAGRISPRLLLWRYPIGLAVVSALALALLLLAWRAIWGRRPSRADARPGA
ncbi:MAG: hypothetical protein AB7L90_12410 [Hyphomicrobiaceae bacterium]